MRMRTTETALKTVGKDREALKQIAPAYAGREGALTAVLQFVYQAIVLGGTGKTEEGRTLERIAADELRHLEILGTLIVRLGADPVYTACPPYPVSHHSAAAVDYSKNLPAMLAADLRLLRGAVESYDRLLGRVKDPAVADVLACLKEENEAHIETLLCMLS